MGCQLTPKTVAASGAVQAGPCVVTAIHGRVTTAGTLKLRATDENGAVILEQPMAAGQVAIDLPGFVRFPSGCYAEFASSLAGGITVYLG